LVVTRKEFYELAGLKYIHNNKASETWKNTLVAACNEKLQDLLEGCNTASNHTPYKSLLFFSRNA
jgi:hypothetical protein